jgi:rRNA maturation protein Nop10
MPRPPLFSPDVHPAVSLARTAPETGNRYSPQWPARWSPNGHFPDLGEKTEEEIMTTSCKK